MKYSDAVEKFYENRNLFTFDALRKIDTHIARDCLTNESYRDGNADKYLGAMIDESEVDQPHFLPNWKRDFCKLVEQVLHNDLVENSELVMLKELAVGEYFRIGSQKVVYVRGDYQRSIKKYSAVKFEDINAERFIKGETLVTTNTGDF